jgi:L-aminopeptidase/D-esterase-like protein
MARPGPSNLITDVPGLKVGHATDERVRTGVTALLCPGGWNAAVDVRGGGPGERELSALSLENLVGQAHAIVLSGGSVFGLGAGDGAAAALSLQGQGLKLHPASPHLPIVPTAILHDLGNGGDKAFGLEPPYRRLGVEAVEAAGAQVELGLVGAGRGAMAGLVPGGLGSASAVLEDGLVVGALAAINPLGSVFMPDGRTFWAWPFEMDDEFGGLRPAADVPRAHTPLPALSRLKTAGRVDAGANTTLAVVAVNAALTGPQLKRIAIMAHDGMARAVHPAHTPFDGDIVFAVAKGERAVESHAEVALIGSAAADCLARAIARGVYESNRPKA